MRLFNFERNYNILKSKSPCILLNGLLCPKEFFLLLYVLYLSYWIHFQNIHTFIYPKTLLHTLFSFFLKSSKDFIVSLRPGSIKTYFRTFLEITLSKYYKAVTCWIICFKYYKIFFPCFFDVKRKLKSPSMKRSFATLPAFFSFNGSLCSSTLGPHLVGPHPPKYCKNKFLNKAYYLFEIILIQH